MNPVLYAQALQALPRSVRQTLYTALVALGAALSLLSGIGIHDIGTLSVDRALEIYAYLASAVGVVAVANVKPVDKGFHVEHEEDVDLSSFEPIGDPGDVYGADLS